MTNKDIGDKLKIAPVGWCLMALTIIKGVIKVNIIN